MSDAEKLQEEINYLSVLIRRHKEGNAANRGNFTRGASKYTWSNARQENTSNRLSNVTARKPQHISSSMQRGEKRRHQTWEEHSPSKIVRHYAQRTPAAMARKTGVTFDSKFKWTKNSQTPVVKVQSTLHTPDIGVTSHISSGTSCMDSNSSLPDSASTRRKPSLKPSQKNTKYKYRKPSTNATSLLTPKNFSTQSKPRDVVKRRASSSARRFASPKFASPKVVSNPYKLNRSGSKKVSHPRAIEGHHLRRKTLKAGRAIDKQQRFGENTTHITLSKVALEALLKKHSVTLKQALAKRAVAKSHGATRFKKHEKKQYCIYYGRFGKCMRGDSCRFIHDPSRVAVCTRFLRGTCRDEKCSFSHNVAPEKVPVCLFFLRGKCSVPNCPYLHVYLGKNAPVCKRFASDGYCPDAEKCKMQHIKCCPEYYETGTCPKAEACELPHIRINTYRTKSEAPMDGKNERKEKEKHKTRAGCDIKEDGQALPVVTTSSSCPDFLSLTVNSPQAINQPVRRQPVFIKPRLNKLLSKQSLSSSQ